VGRGRRCTAENDDVGQANCGPPSFPFDLVGCYVGLKSKFRRGIGSSLMSGYTLFTVHLDYNRKLFCKNNAFLIDLICNINGNDSKSSEAAKCTWKNHELSRQTTI
jgi:hypothetical protein